VKNPRKVLISPGQLPRLRVDPGFEGKPVETVPKPHPKVGKQPATRDVDDQHDAQRDCHERHEHP
jgi:hypothetical protein